MATQLARVAIVGLVLGGCELIANIPSYTAAGDGGGSGGDGGGGDDGGVDAMAECELSTECAAPEVCVMGQCQPCDRDAHCGPADANVCLPDGTCAAPGRILYAAPNGTGGVCSLAAPCDIQMAFTNAAASVTFDIVKLAPGTYPRDAQIAVGTDTVILAGEGATVMATAVTAMFRVTTGSLTIVGAELVGMQQFNALCFGMAGQLGTVNMHRVMTRGGAYGVGGFTCNVGVSRSTVMQNSGIGVYVNGGTARITNSVVMANGFAGSGEGGVQLLQVSDARVEMSTITGNTSENDLYGGGLTCTGSTNVVTTSISWGNVGTAKGPLDQECNVSYSVVEPAYAGGTNNVRMDPLFQAVGNFHLQATSPARGAGDPALTMGVDFDNEARPQGGGAFDCGADEIP
jgi:hypothetical protein